MYPARSWIDSRRDRLGGRRSSRNPRPPGCEMIQCMHVELNVFRAWAMRAEHIQPSHIYAACRSEHRFCSHPPATWICRPRTVLVMRLHYMLGAEWQVQESVDREIVALSRRRARGESLTRGPGRRKCHCPATVFHLA